MKSRGLMFLIFVFGALSPRSTSRRGLLRGAKVRQSLELS